MPVLSFLLRFVIGGLAGLFGMLLSKVSGWATPVLRNDVHAPVFFVWMAPNNFANRDKAKDVRPLTKPFLAEWRSKEAFSSTVLDFYCIGQASGARHRYQRGRRSNYFIGWSENNRS
jgi:hypothetical protein